MNIFIDNIRKCHKTIISIYDLFTKLKKDLSQIDFTSTIFYSKMESFGWPPCIDLSKDIKSKILDISITDVPDNISKIIIDSYDEIIDDILSRWKCNYYINPKRLPILEEAIENYKYNRYASCVTILTCQYGGIINDTHKFISDNKNLSPKLNRVRERQKRHIKNTNSKSTNKYIKKQLDSKEFLIAERILFSTNFKYVTLLFKNYMEAYIYSHNLIETIPNRHKICHGEHLDFATKENALKSILITDFLIRLYLYIPQEDKNILCNKIKKVQ